ncbi:MAG: hypothetical protein NC412_03045 [Roseburia sp.]|nr:hypothetical protein [Roseburia sp.]MCM1279397.1 hypothetical protein [Robinsoniella sp.]
MGKKIAKGFYSLSYILFCVFAAAMLLFGLEVWNDAEFLFATQKPIVLALIVAAGAFFLGAFFLKLSHVLHNSKEKRLWTAIAFISLLMIILQFLALHVLEISYLWDGVNVFSSAVSRLKGNDVVELYFSRYTNQNGFLAVTYSLLKIGRLFGLAEADYVYYLNIWNLIFMDGAIALAAAILYRLRKEKKAAAVLLFLIITALNPFIYLWTAFYYTSILVMPVFLGIVYLLLCMEEQKKWQIKMGQTVMLAVLFVLGTRLRQTTVILAIAVILTKLVTVGFRREKGAEATVSKRGYLTVVYIAVFCLCLFLTNYACKSYETKINNLDTTDTAFPAIHWIMMGLDHGGEYNNSDADYTASFLTHEEKVQGDIELLTARLKHFGIRGISKTYLQKFINTWVSASNAYPFRLSVCQKYTAVHDLVFGDKKDFVIYYHQIYQIFLLFFILSGAIRKWKEKKPDGIYILQLSFLGTILFHLLWEAGPLYSVSLQIVYFLLGAYGILNFPPKPATKKQAIMQPAEHTGAHGSKGYLKNTLFFVGICITALFFLCNINTFTKETKEREKRVVNQYLASDNLKVQKDEQVSQTFLATRDFNYLNIHLCNHENEKNTSIYQLTLSGEKHGIVYEETIYAKDILLDSFLMRTFETVSIQDPEQFTLSLKALESQGDNFLEVIYFQMKDYNPYTKGIFAKDGNTLKGDMFLMISEKTNAPYVGRKPYAIVAGLFLLVELAVWLFVAGAGRKRSPDNNNRINAEIE